MRCEKMYIHAMPTSSRFVNRARALWLLCRIIRPGTTYLLWLDIYTTNPALMKTCECERDIEGQRVVAMH